jgi:poly(3-hydroxybutyrate) depolymerase
MVDRRGFLIGTAFLLAASGRAGAQASPAPLPPGRGTFTFTGWAGPALDVFYQLPDTVTEATPVLFVHHGVNRNADDYRDEWARHATRRGFIVVAPEYDDADFPGAEGYGSGGFLAPDGTTRPRDHWSFAAIEPLFDEVRARTGSRVPRYIMYGHSGGAQFVQRFVLMMPEARYLLAIAANAGWYTMPDFDVDFPYGLNGAPVTRADLARTLQRPLWILLGGDDTNARSPNLRHSREAERQGPNRRERGDSFYAAAGRAAETLGVRLAWQRRYVPGVGHDNAGMTAAAANLVVPPSR